MWRLEKKTVLLCEASRAPSCSNVVTNEDDIAKGECARACGSGSQCRPNECIFGSGKLWGSGFWVKGYMSQVREMGKLVYEQPGNEVDGSCHSKEGSK